VESEGKEHKKWRSGEKEEYGGLKGGWRKRAKENERKSGGRKLQG